MLVAVINKPYLLSHFWNRSYEVALYDLIKRTYLIVKVKDLN